MRTIEGEKTCIELLLTFLLIASLYQFVTFTNQIFRISQILCGQLTLYTYQTLHQRLIFLKHLIIALRHGTRDDQRCTGIIDQHGVNLIDDGVVMRTLYEVSRRYGHVITQIVETELIVRTEGDICLISLTTCLRVGLVLVDTINTQTMEHIERSHPFRVTLCQIVVHGHHVYTVASQGIQEDGEGSHEGLTFTSRHLGNLALMEYGTTEELHVIVDHFPLQIVTAGSPVVMIDSLVAINRDKVFLGISSQLAIEICSSHNSLFVLCETTGCLFHDGKHLRHHPIKCFLVDLEHFFLNLIDLCEDISTFINGCVLDSCLQFCNTGLLGTCRILYLLLQFLRPLAEGIVIQ